MARKRLYLLLLPSCVLVACGATNPTTGAAPHATASVTRTLAASPPPGGPVPSQLIGDWVQMGSSTPSDTVDLILNATTFSFATSGESNFGDIVVNGTEIDFFNGDGCGLRLPDGIGRYNWTLGNGTLHFKPLAQDPCDMRSSHLADQTYTKAS